MRETAPNICLNQVENWCPDQPSFCSTSVAGLAIGLLELTHCKIAHHFLQGSQSSSHTLCHPGGSPDT